MPEAVRIALVGRAGEARELLHRLLSQSGGLIAVEGDPAELAPEQVIQARPEVLILSLQGGEDEVLDRWDSVLDRPGLNVIFDESEVSQKLAGWDQSRWARHLASKALGRDISLPPAPAGAELLPERDPMPRPGAPPSPAAFHADARLEDYAREAHGLITEIPADQIFTAPAAGASSGVPDFQPEPETAPEPALSAASEEDLAALVAALDAQHGYDAGAGAPSAPPPDGLEADIEEEEEITLDSSLDPGQAEPDEPPPAPAPARVDFSSLALEPMEAQVAAVSPPAAPPPAARSPAAVIPPPEVDFDRLIAGLALGAEAAAPKSRSAAANHGHLPNRPGAVVILAGLGGPDALRRLLANLRAEVPVPVLVCQYLAQNNHDRLLPQLAKVSPLPVYLAQVGDYAPAGAVALLPGGVAPIPQEEGLIGFSSADEEPLSALADLAGDLILAMLSGAPLASIGPAVACAERGALLLAQDPEQCFDAAAPTEFRNRGALVGSPEELARRILERLQT